MSETLISASEATGAIPLHAMRRQDLDRFLARRRPGVRAQIEARAFKGSVGQTCAVLGAGGKVELALVGLGGEARPDAMALRAASAKLPSGDYRLAAAPRGLSAVQAAIAWGLGSYTFDRYKKGSDRSRPRLVVGGAELAEARRIVHACALARDMVNTPANDLGPLQIETIAREIAERYGARLEVTVGEALRDAGYPAVLAVGRAAEEGRAPRMIELSWGSEGPLVAIVGKGVVFDTGGLDLKSSSSMRLMKKDMGGAAHALALGRMIMDAGLKVRLVVLVPAVENAVSGAAMRPGDVISSRKGLSIEIGNTDAEGRLILADALARAAELEPELTIDMATLTGAARMALGPQVIPFFTDDDRLAQDLSAASGRASDPLWRLPLWPGYAEAVDGDIADLRNDPEGWAQAGSITAALFLKRFAPERGWVDLDIFAWNPKSRPGWPVGAEAQAIRALYDLISRRFPMSDARTLLARSDLADQRLEGLAKAARFAAPTPMRCKAAIAGIFKVPDEGSMREDEILFGEGFEVLETGDGWAWGQAHRDGYVGFIRAEALAPASEPPTLRVSALRTCGFERPDLKSPVVALLSMNSLVGSGENRDGYVDTGEGGWVWAAHLAPIGVFETDAPAVAERFLGAPYLWGGRSSLGLDCSGLIQQALYATGRACPRDTDQQLAAFPHVLERGDLERGDLVFWKGHMGMMLDGERMIHANAHHMAVAVELVDEALVRIEKAGVPFRGFRRP